MQNHESEKSSENALENGAEGLIKFANISFGTMVHNLERCAGFLRIYSVQDGHIIDGTRIPEYLSAKNALEQYRDALIARIKENYKKRKK
jgi:hypothetical protein